jgi:hypothetical protein
LLIFIFIGIGFLIAAPEWMIDEMNKVHPEYKMDVSSEK